MLNLRGETVTAAEAVAIMNHARDKDIRLLRTASDLPTLQLIAQQRRHARRDGLEVVTRTLKRGWFSARVVHGYRAGDYRKVRAAMDEPPNL